MFDEKYRPHRRVATGFSSFLITNRKLQTVQIEFVIRPKTASRRTANPLVFAAENRNRSCGSFASVLSVGLQLQIQSSAFLVPQFLAHRTKMIACENEKRGTNHG